MNTFCCRAVWLCLIWALAAAGCSKKDNIPAGILDEKEMSSVLLDMQEAEAYNESYIDSAFRVEDREKRLKRFYAQILIIHHITKKEFLSSYSFYESRPDLMQKVYNRMQAEVDRKKANADSAAMSEEQRSAAVHRKNALINKFNSYKLPYRRYGDSILDGSTKIFRPKQLYAPGKSP